MVKIGSVKAVVDKLSSVLRADGGSLAIVSVERTTGLLKLRLLLDDANCADCVLPAEHIEDLVLSALQKSACGINRVVVEDPRVRL